MMIDDGFQNDSKDGPDIRPGTDLNHAISEYGDKKSDEEGDDGKKSWT
jgi:hypothetical protein